MLSKHSNNENFLLFSGDEFDFDKIVLPPVINELQKQRNSVKETIHRINKNQIRLSDSKFTKQNCSKTILNCVHSAMEMLSLTPDMKALLTGEILWHKGLKNHLNKNELSFPDTYLLCELLFLDFNQIFHGYNEYAHLRSIERALLHSRFHFNLGKQTYDIKNNLTRRLLNKATESDSLKPVLEQNLLEDKSKLKIVEQIKKKNKKRTSFIKSTLENLLRMPYASPESQREMLQSLFPNYLSDRKINCENFLDKLHYKFFLLDELDFSYEKLFHSQHYKMTRKGMIWKKN